MTEVLVPSSQVRTDSNLRVLTHVLYGLHTLS